MAKGGFLFSFMKGGTFDIVENLRERQWGLFFVVVVQTVGGVSTTYCGFVGGELYWFILSFLSSLVVIVDGENLAAAGG